MKSGPRRVGVKSSVALRLSARARRGGVDSGVIKPSFKGGIFSLLLPSSSCVREVRGRFGLGEDSGVCSCSQTTWTLLAEDDSWWPRFPRTVPRRVCIAKDDLLVVVVERQRMPGSLPLCYPAILNSAIIIKTRQTRKRVVTSRVRVSTSR